MNYAFKEPDRDLTSDVTFGLDTAFWEREAVSTMPGASSWPLE